MWYYWRLYYPIYDDKYEFYHYLNCSKNSEGYYFDDKDSVYKLCYSSCKICDKSGNETEHNCKECKYGNDYITFFEKYKNCYPNCSNYYKYEFRKQCFTECPFNSTNRENITELDGFPLDKRYFCKPICIQDVPFEMIFTQECVKNCPIKALIDKSCILNFKSAKDENKEENEENKDEKEEMIKAIDAMLENVEIGFTSEDYDTSGLESGNNDV